MTSDREIADGIMSAHYEFWDDPIEANRRSPKLEAIRDAIAAALASVRPKPTTSDKAAADGIVDEIAQKGVSLDDKQWDFAVEAIAAALADKAARLQAEVARLRALLPAPKGDTDV